MSNPTLPIDFAAIRAAMVREVQRVTLLTCIVEETNANRPPKPYFSFKLTTPSSKSGDDTTQAIPNSTVVNRGGVRKMSVSFHVYALDKDQAYNYMALWQACLDQFTTQEWLRRAGIAVWLIGNVADLSQLLNTGYEGRTQMDVQFGIASNLTEDLGAIEKVAVTGTIQTDTGTVVVPFTEP